MANEVVKALLVEIDGNVEKLRRAVRQGESELSGFATKAKKTSTEAGAGADAMADKQAGAARAIASATETIARQGKVSGDAAKQLIAQAANVAFAFGPTGAIAGAIGIATLAIVGMFARTREEVEQTERRAIQAMNKFAEMDANAQAREWQRSFKGTRFADPIESVVSGSDWDDPDKRRELLRNRGTTRLSEVDLPALRRDRDRLAALSAQAVERAGKESSGVNPFKDELARRSEQIQVIEKELAEFEVIQKRSLALLQETAAESARVTAEAARLTAGTKGQTEAEKERAAGLEELSRKSEQLADRTRRLVEDTAATASSRMADEFDAAISEAMQLMAEGVDVEANSARVEQLERAKEAAVAAARALEEAAAAMSAIEFAEAAGQTPAWMSIERLNDAAGKLRAQLASLTPGTAAYLRVQSELLKVTKKLTDLSESNDPKKGEGGGTPKVDARDMADYAREVQQAADGALQLAQNLGGAAANTVTMLRGIGQVVGNLPRLAEALASGDVMGIVSSGLAIAGGLSSALGDPRDAARLRAIEENTDALRDLTKRAGLLGLGVSGESASTASAQLREFLRGYAPGAGTIVAGGRQYGATDQARVAAKAFGLDLAELEDLAAKYGITLNGNIRTFEQLSAALADTITKLGEFGDDLESQLRQADAEIALRGVTDPLERLGIRQGAYAGRSAALDRVTAGLDLSTAEGRAAARANALALFEVLKAGGEKLGAGDLGGLTGDELLQALLDLIESLNAVEDVAADAAGSTVGAVSGYTGLSAAEGARIADYNRALVGYAREAQATRLAMLSQLETLAARAMAPVPVPPMSALTADVLGGGVGSAAGGVQIVIAEGAIQQVFHVAGGAAAVRDLAANGLEVAVNDALYRSLRRAQMARGDLRAPGRA